MEAKEFAFDVQLIAAVRVVATSEEAARAALPPAIDCLDLCGVEIPADSSRGITKITLTEASLSCDPGEKPHLFEIDGEIVE